MRALSSFCFFGTPCRFIPSNSLFSHMYTGYQKIIHSSNKWLRKLERNFTSNNYDFTLSHSVTYIQTPEIQPFKKERWKPSLFTNINCVDAGVNATRPLLECCRALWILEIGPLWCSPLFFKWLSLDVGHRIRWGRIHCIQK